MSWSISEYHEDVKNSIDAGIEGFAQAVLDVEPRDNLPGTLVSFEKGFPSTMTHAPFVGSTVYKIDELLPLMIITIAKKGAAVSPKTFSRKYVEHMISDARRYPAHWASKHKTADDLQAFYIDGPGATALYD